MSWRLADVCAVAGDPEEASNHLHVARSGYETLLEKHLLAFADHGAEFYSGGGGDPLRAFDLARQNLANRPTLRAFEQARATALAAGKADIAMELLVDARMRWGGAAAFHSSPLANGADHCPHD